VVRERSVSLLPDGCDRLAAMDAEDGSDIAETSRLLSSHEPDGDSEARVRGP
jgi:hypothetical protein